MGVAIRGVAVLDFVVVSVTRASLPTEGKAGLLLRGGIGLSLGGGDTTSLD